MQTLDRKINKTKLRIARITLDRFNKMMELIEEYPSKLIGDIPYSPAYERRKYY